MPSSNTEVVIVGAGAAGLAAGRRLHEAGVPCLILEARARRGGRAWTVVESGLALDLGAGWLHSADRNPWADIASQQGRSIDKTPPPWERPSIEDRFPVADQRDYFRAQRAFDERLEAEADREPDRNAAAFLEPGCRWNALMDAVSTYYSGAELAQLSARDLASYREDNANWRIVGGLGTTIEAHGANLPVELQCTVRRIDHTGRRLTIETTKGNITADRAIVTLPSSLLTQPDLFTPALPDKAAAAAGLPLGLADKMFLSLEGAEEFAENSRVFGSIDRVDTGSYNVRPFGWPMIEAYFGGQLAWRLEEGGDAAFLDYATSELTEFFGASFARRIKLLRLNRWGADPFAQGSYSYATPGNADSRTALAEPVDDRLFFAGEASSLADFSTVHGAFATGVAAADAVIAARKD